MRPGPGAGVPVDAADASAGDRAGRLRTGIFEVGVRLVGGRLGHGLGAALERTARWPSGRLAVLTYHRVAPRTDRPTLHPGLLSADPQSFRDQVAYLARHATVVDLASVLAALDGIARLPSRAVLLTFDDAYPDVADHAWPVLREAGLPAVLFVPTGFPDTRLAFWWDRLYAAIELGRRPRRLATLAGEVRLDTAEHRGLAFRALRERLKALPHDEAMSAVDELLTALGGPPVPPATLGWDALRRLAGEGMTLAPHSRWHPVLPALAADRLREELTGPLDDLRREIGTAPPVLAYPGGIHDSRVRAAARDAGYRLAFTTRRGAIPSLGLADPYALPRINVGGRSTVALLRIQLAPATDRLLVHRGAGDDRRGAGAEAT